MKNRYV